jgi:hypothetical protein
MTMCLFHGWGKWERYELKFITVERINSKEYSYIKYFQKRICKKCNKLQVEEIFQ